MHPTEYLMALAAIYSPPRPAPSGTTWAWWGEGRDSPDRYPYGRPLQRWERQQADAFLAREAEIAARAESHPSRRFCRAVNAALRAAAEAGLAPAYDWPGDPAGQFNTLRRLGMPAHHAAHYVAWAPLANSVLAGIYCPRDVAR
ncbi:MAG: hypothetical protein N2690_00785, partial [Rhodocyclaceae bacterium]|nr:hypothetical protein [Rhodocyclaceae bacterium]